MKKISTLILAGLAAIAASASARPPQVILRTASNYDVRIDGRMYKADNTMIPYLNPGVHTVEIYQLRSGGLFGNRKTLVSSQQFTLQNNDINIDVNQYGRARISEDRFNGRGNNRTGNWNNGYGNGNQYPGNNRDKDDNRRDRDNDNRGNGQNYPNRDYGNNGQYNNGQYNNAPYDPYRKN